VWQIEWKNIAKKDLESLDRPIQKKILLYLREHVTEDPRRFGKALVSDKAGLWRYRVEKYRIICQIKDDTVTVLVVAVGHRKDVYE
jgi:mRNA interferase RelE/StbE